MSLLRHTPLLLAALLVAFPAGTTSAVAATSATAAAALTAAPKAAPSVLPFIDDDLSRALAEAKQRNLPLFVESWAPW